MRYLQIQPSELGDTIRDIVAVLQKTATKVSQSALLYAEKQGGFQCRTCKFAVATNATHGHCIIMDGTIHLDEGCCAAWMANLAMLQLHREY